MMQPLLSFKPMLVGQDPLHENVFGARCLDGLRVMTSDWRARCGVFGISQVANVPIHQLMGTYKIGTRYASSAVFESIEEYADVRYKEAGWQAYKIHPPAIPERDIKICEGFVQWATTTGLC